MAANRMGQGCLSLVILKESKNVEEILPTATDMFCGAGGSSQGATKGGAQVVMAMNHWSLAVETHNTNFSEYRP